MSSKLTAQSGGQNLFTANQSCWVSIAALGAKPIYVQAGVTTVFSTDVLYQNTPNSMWTPHQVDYFVVGT